MARPKQRGQAGDKKASSSSGKQKRQKLDIERAAKRQAAVAEHRAKQIASGKVIIANPTQQAPNNSYSPPTEYLDVEFTCVDCGRVEVWSAKQQQWWYEVAKGTIYSRAIRCRDCRRKRKSLDGTNTRRANAEQGDAPKPRIGTESNG